MQKIDTMLPAGATERRLDLFVIALPSMAVFVQIVFEHWEWLTPIAVIVVTATIAVEVHGNPMLARFRLWVCIDDNGKRICRLGG